MANQRKGKHLKESTRTQSGEQSLMTEWENASDQVVIGFWFYIWFVLDQSKIEAKQNNYFNNSTWYLSRNR